MLCADRQRLGFGTPQYPYAGGGLKPRTPTGFEIALRAALLPEGTLRGKRKWVASRLKSIIE